MRSVSLDLARRLTLRRVHRGHVCLAGQRFVDRGRPLPQYVEASLGALLAAGYLRLDGEAWGLRAVRATPAGERLHRALEDPGRHDRQEDPMNTTFADGPLASDSEQFGLARPRDLRPSDEPPSPPGVRPWGLRWMVPGALRAQPLPALTYCSAQQVVVDRRGHPLILTGALDASADSVSDGDGDEGRSEDWKYDFLPDSPRPT